jgi:hypothetical protein
VSGDDEMKGIMVWMDANSNAVLDNEELSTVESHGIVSWSPSHYSEYVSTATTLTDGSF